MTPASRLLTGPAVLSPAGRTISPATSAPSRGIGVHELIFDFRGQSIAESIERLQRFAAEVMPLVDS